MADNFLSGFAQGLARSQEHRRLRDVLQFQRDQQAAQSRRADRQLDLQERGLGLREQEALDLRQYRQQNMENNRRLLEIQERSAAIQQEMQLRQMDAAVLGGLEKVFDPRIPAPLRSLILRQSAPQLGIDPKSQAFKDFTDTVTKLDSDSLTTLSRAIQLMVPGAEPGEITALASQVMSGQMNIGQVIDIAKSRAAALREQREQQLLEQELGGEATGVLQQGSARPSQTVAPSPPQSRGSGAFAETSVDLIREGDETPLDIGIPIPGSDAMPPAKQAAVQRDLQRSGTDLPTQDMTPESLRKSALVFLKHGMKDAAAFARQLAKDLEDSDAGTFLQVDPKTGQVIFSQGGQAKPFTEGQSKDLAFATRAKGALKNLDPVDVELTSFKGRLFERDPTGVFRGSQRQEFQRAMQASLEFLQAILRKDTGAAITQQEQDEYGRTYLPQPGDGPEVIEQKRASRRRAIIALESGMSGEQILRLELADRAEGALPTPQTQAEFDALPSGALFVDPDDGKTYRKD